MYEHKLGVNFTTRRSFLQRDSILSKNKIEFLAKLRRLVATFDTFNKKNLSKPNKSAF